MARVSQTRAEDEEPFSYEDGREFNEDGHVTYVAKRRALQAGDIITLFDCKTDLRVVQVSPEGVLGIRMDWDVVDARENVEVVPWEDIMTWTDRHTVEKTDAFFAEYEDSDIRRKKD